VVIEKPFGSDLSSAQALNHAIHQVLDESQIYRIDPYLARRPFRTCWSFVLPMPSLSRSGTRNYVDHVQIHRGQDVGVGASSGHTMSKPASCATVFQNHLLQLLTLIPLEPPAFVHRTMLCAMSASKCSAPCAPYCSSSGGRAHRGRPIPGILQRRRCRTGFTDSHFCGPAALY